MKTAPISSAPLTSHSIVSRQCPHCGVGDADEYKNGLGEVVYMCRKCGEKISEDKISEDKISEDKINEEATRPVPLIEAVQELAKAAKAQEGLNEVNVRAVEIAYKRLAIVETRLAILEEVTELPEEATELPND